MSAGIDDEPSWAERIGRHVDALAGEFPDDDVAPLLAEASFRLDDALADGDFMTVQDDVEDVLAAARTLALDGTLLAHAVVVRLSRLETPVDRRPAGVPKAPEHDWRPVFEDRHGWDDDQDQEVVRAVHERDQSADAIRLYVNAVDDAFSMAVAASDDGATSRVTALLATVSLLATRLDEAHARWRAAMASLMALDPGAAGPAAAFHADVLAALVRKSRAAGDGS